MPAGDAGGAVIAVKAGFCKSSVHPKSVILQKFVSSRGTHIFQPCHDVGSDCQAPHLLEEFRTSSRVWKTQSVKEERPWFMLLQNLLKITPDLQVCHTISKHFCGVEEGLCGKTHGKGGRVGREMAMSFFDQCNPILVFTAWETPASTRGNAWGCGKDEGRILASRKWHAACCWPFALAWSLSQKGPELEGGEN